MQAVSARAVRLYRVPLRFVGPPRGGCLHMFHLPTLIFATTVVAFGFTVAMLLLSRLIPQEKSLRHWAASALVFVCAIGLHLQRGQWPDVLTWWLSNGLLATGAVLAWTGARALRGLPPWHALPVQGLAVFWLLNLGLHLLWREDVPRMVLLSAGMGLALAGSAREFWLMAQQRLPLTVRTTAAVMAVGAALFMLRAAVVAGGQNTHTLADHPAWVQASTYAFGLLFFMWSTVAVAVIVGDKLMERLGTALRMARESDRAKSTFLASVTHEWRTPLNAISGFAQLMEQDEQNPAEARQSAARIRAAGARMLDVVNNLIDLRALQEGTMSFKPEVCHIQPLVNEALADARASARQTGVNLVCLGAGRNPAVWADPLRFKQVLAQLLSNAILFNRPKGLVRLRWEDDGQTVFVSVADEGPGIPADKHHRVFTPFDRLGVESGDVPGTGIGLAISQRLVQRMGGAIGFSVGPAGGCTFWVSFPVAEVVQGAVVLQTGGLASGAHPDYPSTLPVSMASPMLPHGKRVLYVEDHRVNQQLVKAVFGKQMGTEVVVATTAEEGLALARKNPPDLILMDLNLPGMDGYTALAHLRADPDLRHIPVMAVTAQAGQEDVERGRAAGFDAYITKPLNLGHLVSLATQLIRRRDMLH